MGLGINLGNVLELQAKKLPPKREPKEAYFDAYAQAGFRNVRIPVRWDKHTGKQAPYEVEADWLALVEQTVDWSLERGLVTVLNTHHETWLDSAAPGVFTRQLPRLLAIWTQVAERFASKSENLLFELFNEPHLMTTEDLNTLIAESLEVIRKSNPTRIVLINGLKFGNPAWILQNPDALQIPKDSQLMLEVHNYDPFDYAGGSPTVFSWGSASDRAALAQWASGLQAWATQHSLPVYYGEFGCTSAQNASTGELAWFQAHAEVIQTHGWGASVWDDGGKHVVLDRETLTWDRDILKALGMNSSQSVLV